MAWNNKKKIFAIRIFSMNIFIDANFINFRSFQKWESKTCHCCSDRYILFFLKISLILWTVLMSHWIDWERVCHCVSIRAKLKLYQIDKTKILSSEVQGNWVSRPAKNKNICEHLRKCDVIKINTNKGLFVFSSSSYKRDNRLRVFKYCF